MRKLIFTFFIICFLISAAFLLTKSANLFQKDTHQQKIPDSIQDGHIILAAGDIADCVGEGGEATRTATLLDSLPGTILTLGDNAYPDGTKEDFATCFEPTWGRHKERIYPSVGNHEYHTKDAQPYYEYFGVKAGDSGKGYYSFNLSTWHLIAINTQIFDIGYLCPEKGNNCGEVVEQMEWIKRDLQQNKTDCTLVFGHHPRFSSGVTSASEGLIPLWESLYTENVDVVLAGHAHDYERFLPLNAQGEPDPQKGIRQFVVGTGGAGLNGFVAAENIEVVTNSVHGILKLVLGKGEYEWEFISLDGSFVDKGRSSCH